MHQDEKPFDAIVSNPPYSIKWIGDTDPTLINDERFAPTEISTEIICRLCVYYAFIIILIK